MVRRMSIKKQFKCKWFPEYMKLSDIRERFKYTAYKEVKADLKDLTDEKILEFYKGHGDWFYGKIFFIKGKKFIYVYSANENKLEQAVTESLGQSLQEAWIFSQKKRNFDYLFQVRVVHDMRRIVEKAIDDQVKEKELIREELLKFKYMSDDMRKIVVKETDDLIKEQELIKEKLSRFKYTEEDLEKRVAKAVKSRDSRLKYMEEEYKYMEKDVDDILALYKYTEKDLELMVAQKLEERINEQREKDKEIISKFKYTEEDVNELVAKAIEDQIKEKNLFKENIIKTAREIADFSVSSVNKDRQTEVLFKEIQKANAKWMTNGNFSKLDDKLREPLDVNGHVTDKGMEGTYKDLSQKEIAGEVPVSAEEIEIYNKELSRGTVSSEGTEDSSESENGETILEGKKQVMGGGKSKKGSKSRKSKKKSKKGWVKLKLKDG
ncbi:hypothetical protein C1646_811952 [Rhizophagus diaphanus]|nr:hypothetical protein C1646_811952 [Rhizophagus diaphanus] [Rhizophagus sp. MUCL 43196]